MYAARPAVGGRAERDLGAAGEQDEIAGLAARRPDVLRNVGEPPDRADDRGRPDVRAVRRVVQRHVPRDHGNPQRFARGHDPLDRPRQLPRTFRALGIADVEAVRDRERRRAHAHEIARRLRDRGRSSDERIDRRESWLRIDRERDAVVASFDAHDRCISSRTNDGVGADHLVVRAIDRSSRRDRRRGKKFEQLQSDLRRCRLRLGRGGCRARGPLRASDRSTTERERRRDSRCADSPLVRAAIRRRKFGDVVLGRVVGERSRRQLGNELVGIEDLEKRLGGHVADPGAM